MAKRSHQETRYETRRREVARRREDTVAYAPSIPTNRTERRLMGDTAANRVPKFKSVEEADRWMEKQERIAYRQRALMTETRDGVWPATWQRGVKGSHPHMHEVDVAEWF